MPKNTDRRTSGRTTEAIAVCPCGCDWFTFTARPENPGYPPDAVHLDERGRVTAYAGIPVCAKCGTVWVSRRERLKAVE